ncbi:NAD(P)-binding protein [Xylariaceae sp. FL1651]|nr:NAD(P)-binding protein [Xylariaceae sp. FL1651]
MASSKEPSTAPATMRAWLYSRAGSNLATAMTLNPHARRPPTPLPADRLLVRVTHMSPNPADYKVSELGQAASALATGSFAAASPGMDYAGVIEEIGSDVLHRSATSGEESSQPYKVGDAVYGRVEKTAFGTLGAYVQPAASGCVPLPPGVDPAHASTLGTAAQTAYQALVPYVRAGRGDEVFVNGGSGGVGTFAVQIAARALGCVVTASCSARNVALCASLGATTVLDYTSSSVTEALRARGRVFRLVVDNVGSSPPDLYKAADDYMLPEGTYVQIGAEPRLADICALASRALLPAILGGGKRSWKFLVFEQRREDLQQLGRWMQEGKIKAIIDGDIFQFEDAPKVFEKLKTGRTRGNLVVKVSD